MKTVRIAAAALALPSAALAVGTRTVDAAAVPVAELTEATKRVAARAPEYCHPSNGRDGEPRRYVVRFDIEADGTTSGVRAADGLGDIVDDCAGAAERAVRQWTFTPPTHEGEPVRVTGVVTTIGYEPRGRFGGYPQ